MLGDGAAAPGFTPAGFQPVEGFSGMPRMIGVPRCLARRSSRRGMDDRFSVHPFLIRPARWSSSWNKDRFRISWGGGIRGAFI
ncbi:MULTISPECIES: hypothetical protein [Ralstonia solanacearum species complex]|uniref:hypothetical protein n=1 Tax=Ralstonia solanacearum species complex TaxID=3116862 RepID=UPI0013C37B15|nr:hypothetical protein [Ralstonia solanacearum]